MATTKNNHSAYCQCPDCKLKRIDMTRELLKKQIEKLDDEEREVLGLKRRAQAM